MSYRRGLGPSSGLWPRLPALSEAGTAVDSYLDQDYDDSIMIMETADSKLAGISADAIALKDRVLLWVCVSEWLVVTCCGMVSGLIVWGLMVRRRMYRSVASTRLVLER